MADQMHTSTGNTAVPLDGAPSPHPPEPRALARAIAPDAQRFAVSHDVLEQDPLSRSGVSFAGSRREQVESGGLKPAARRTMTNPALVAVLRSRPPAAHELPDTPEAWAKFADHAIGAGLAGLSLEGLKAGSIEPPAQTLERLRFAATAGAAELLNAMGQLERVARELNRAGISVMLLKGAALNLITYPRPDLRPMTDVDLLVRPESATDALRVLAAGGCRRGLDLIRDDFFPDYYYETELLTTSPRPVRIDLHARPLRPMRYARTISDDAFWRDARPVRVGDAEVWIPSPETMLIHLAAHAALHDCARLMWLYDLRRFVETPGWTVDWSIVTDLARRWRLSLPVVTALERARELIEPVCPPEVIDELRSHRITWCDRLTFAQAPRDAASPVMHVGVNMLCTPGIRHRCGYFLALLRPGKPHLAEIYPFRHRGWQGCAHVWRLARAVRRTCVSSVTLLARVITGWKPVPHKRSCHTGGLSPTAKAMGHPTISS